MALGWLALCRANAGAHSEARELAGHAVGAAPDLPSAHYLYARVLLSCGRLDEAEQATGRFIALDPHDADGRGLLALIRSQRRDWPGALEAAAAGLALDPDHDLSQNVRAMALVHTGDPDRAVKAMEGALQSRPNDAFTHANQGWALLHQGSHREAEAHFREALRLDPEMEWARAGVLESLKARNRVYRLLLRYKLWMDGKTAGRRAMVILGGYLLYRIAIQVMDSVPLLTPVAWTLVIAYWVFCLLTWFGDAIFDFLLTLHPFGRHALRRREWIGAAAVCAVLGVSISTLLIGWARGAEIIVVCGALILVLAAPVHLTFQMRNPRVARAMAAFTVAVAAAGSFTVWNLIDNQRAAEELAPFVLRGTALDSTRKAMESASEVDAGDRAAYELEVAAFERDAEASDLIDRIMHLRSRREMEAPLLVTYILLCMFGSQLLAGFLSARASRK